MYWIPSIFILLEIIIINFLSTIEKYHNCGKLLIKYDDKDLSKYISKYYNGINEITIVIGCIYICELIYFITGLFFSFWLISLMFIIYVISLLLFLNLKKETSTEEIIKMAKLKNFETTNVKLDRLLKISELNISTSKKMTDFYKYIFTIVKICLFLLIIISHYNMDSKIREGYYIETTSLMSEEESKDSKSNGVPYTYTVYVKELGKYENNISKIELQKIEVTSGFDPSKYDWIKSCVKNKFSSFKKSSEIEWLYKK